jgi:hypothetical protein
VQETLKRACRGCCTASHPAPTPRSPASAAALATLLCCRSALLFLQRILNSDDVCSVECTARHDDPVQELQQTFAAAGIEVKVGLQPQSSAAAAAAAAVRPSKCLRSNCPFAAHSQAPPQMRGLSHLTPHTSHLTPHTSHLTPHTSHLTPHTSHLTPHTS